MQRSISSIGLKKRVCAAISRSFGFDAPRCTLSVASHPSVAFMATYRETALRCALFATLFACGSDDTSPTGTADTGADAIGEDTAVDTVNGGSYTFFFSEPVTGGLGIAGFDGFCNAAEGRPDATATYRALLVASTRHPCTTPACEGGNDRLDWPLVASADYVAEGAVVFRTDANAVVTETPSGLLDDSGYNFWSGADRDWTPLEGKNCDDWTAAAGPTEGSLGWTGAPPIPDFFGGHGNWACDTSTPILCVEVP